jgi:hypothetical protein
MVRRNSFGDRCFYRTEELPLLRAGCGSGPLYADTAYGRAGMAVGLGDGAEREHGFRALRSPWQGVDFSRKSIF